MVRPIPEERQLAIIDLLQHNASRSEIKLRFPGVGSSTITRLRKKILVPGNRPSGGRPQSVSEQTQRYIRRLLRTDELDGPQTIQRYLGLIGVELTVHGIRKLLKIMGFKAKRKIKTNFVSNRNKRLRLRWAKKHRHLTVNQWRQWIFSDETRVSMRGSDGTSYFWTDGGDILLPHQIEPQVQGDGGSVMFWGCITAEGPRYGSIITEGTVNSKAYIDILKTSLVDTLEYYNMDRKEVRFQQDNATPHTAESTKKWFSANSFPTQKILDWPAQSPDLNPIEHLWHQLKQKLYAYPTHPTSTHEIESRIETEWYKVSKKQCLRYIDSMPKRIAKVIKAKGGPIRGYPIFLLFTCFQFLL
ncbi:unnamed protein product [Mucor fragilis]